LALKDKEFRFLAKKGYNVTAQSAEFLGWQSLYEKVRKELQRR